MVNNFYKPLQAYEYRSVRHIAQDEAVIECTYTIYQWRDAHGLLFLSTWHNFNRQLIQWIQLILYLFYAKCVKKRAHSTKLIRLMFNDNKSFMNKSDYILFFFSLFVEMKSVLLFGALPMFIEFAYIFINFMIEYNFMSKFNFPIRIEVNVFHTNITEYFIPFLFLKTWNKREQQLLINPPLLSCGQLNMLILLRLR